ncbi:MAG: PDZ domain-containing protein [Bacteroidales bacterium]|jgi:tricorn protease|nr:PDZ domain-containing protein [Bacteroidales bacterium]MDD2570108.1 PDZ domain-containing protein [Bacteroidales bacterium]MDD2812046.1 PDZ domain-containing protein [Bacteroidales bacterium]MDD3811029.1 PDZ domain-containing protein [Bacteroidales bacterium]MDD3871325.1 PDZ domain-containing protein [Bacteroidales bacterium]
MKRKLLFSIFLVLLTLNLQSQEEARLLRFPAIHGDQVVFSYGGDLYSATWPGSTARKLTSHDGFEIFPKFSPDGKTIAFTAQYDGNTEVFTIPSSGGVPERLTHTATLSRDDIGDRMGPNNIVMGWTPDGKEVVYRSRKQTFNDFKGQLFKVSASGGLSEELPFSVAGFNSYSPDGKKLAYNRVFREFRTWKYYQGGMADDVWIFDFTTGKSENITNNPAQDIFPMWAENKIYFLSDRDRTMNLFCYDIPTREISKVTNFKEFDIKFPSLGNERIIFENGGFLYTFNLADGKLDKLKIFIQNDFLNDRKVLKDAAKSIRSIGLSPNGERLIISARGELFNVPAKEGITRNLTRTSDVHEQGASWSPDGKWIAFISDLSGEFEIYIQDPKAETTPKSLTKKNDTYLFGLDWAPNSKSILFSDKRNKLWMVDVESEKKTLVAESDLGPIRQYTWSPDSKWIAFVKPEEGSSIIRLYSAESKKVYEVTDSWYNSGNPVFSRDGKYLVFVSARTFNPTYSSTEWNHSYQDMNKLYLATLNPNTPSPFAPKDDEVATVGETQKADGDQKKDEAPIEIDPENIISRIIELPVPAGNYYGIEAVKDRIYYSYSSSRGRGAFKLYDLKKKKETELGQGLSFSLSPNGKKMLVRQGNRYEVIDLPGGKVTINDPINLSGLKVMVDLQAEWNQIYNESWRHMRDFFYDPGMHGVNWKAMHEKYEPLVNYVSHRSDLSYILGELVGELNVGHAYVNNGEIPTPERIRTGLLGAKISQDDSGYFRVDHIIPGANWSTQLRSPLTEEGAQVKEGEFILSIDGQSVKETNDLYSLLVGKANQLIEMTVSSDAKGNNPRTVLVKTLADESSLYYYNWVQENIRKVDEATNGQVGYIHIPDMGVTGLNEFVKHYYPQLTKKALIIDDRGNGGGNVSPMIIERLQREITYATMNTNQKRGSVNPVGTLTGPKIALIDRYSASDGDLFPYRFRHLNLGKLVGVRTWGGVVGYSGSIPCIDGGSLVTPSYAPYAADGSGFIIEGYGVEPDVVIDNDPYEEYQGIDRQLDKAIELILEEMKTYKKTVPPIPDFPKKNR